MCGGGGKYTIKVRFIKRLTSTHNNTRIIRYKPTVLEKVVPYKSWPFHCFNETISSHSGVGSKSCRCRLQVMPVVELRTSQVAFFRWSDPVWYRQGPFLFFTPDTVCSVSLLRFGTMIAKVHEIQSDASLTMMLLVQELHSDQNEINRWYILRIGWISWFLLFNYCLCKLNSI